MSSWQPGTLPPVGFECEIAEPIFNAGTKVRVLCHDEGAAVCRILEGDKLHSLCQLEMNEIRPIRTEAERKREEAMNAIWNSSGIRARDGGRQAAFDIYDAIASGKIPHITLK